MTDTEVVDRIALGLGTQSKWGSDELEWIADLIGMVRPHPGDTDPARYLREWEQGRGPVTGSARDYVSDELEEER